MNKIIPKEHKMTLKIASYDVGAEDRIHLSAVLRYQQEAGEQHLQHAGLGWQAMIEMGMVFVTSRWHTVIHRLPRMDETVTLTTWHRNRKGPRFFRCYEWKDAEGNLLIEGVMQFALVSVEQHRLLRGDEFMERAPLPDTDRTVSCADPGRFAIGETAPVGTYTVRRSDMDRNGHMNNTHYADLMLDFVPTGVEGVPTAVQLHFAGECVLGDTLTMAAAPCEGGYTVVGDTDRGRAFAAYVTVGAR